MTSPVDTLDWTWRIEQGEREEISIPVLDDNDDPFPVIGWTIDAKIKDRPGGIVLYTWPLELTQIHAGGSSVKLVVPADVSETWRFTTGWYRVKIIDPESDPDDLVTHRILQGPLIISPD